MTWVMGASPEIDAQSRWKAIMATTLVFTIVMVTVVAARFWIRRRTIYQEDWIVLVTMFSSLVYSVSVILQTRLGLGLPVLLRPAENWKPYAISSYASRPFYLWGLAGFKLALCISYLRMTKGSTDRSYRRFIIGVAIFSTVAQIIFIGLYLCWCVPFEKIYDLDTIGTCLPFAPVNYTISVTAILCDVVIFLLPLPLIYRLHLDRAVKLGLVVIFSLGLLTTVLSIMRATQIHRVAYEDGDASYFIIRSGLELNIGIITSCLPVLRPILNHIPRKILAIIPLGSTSNRTDETDTAAELQGDYFSTQTIGGGSYHLGTGRKGSLWRNNKISNKSLKIFDKSIDRMMSTTTRERENSGSNEDDDDYSHLTSRIASTRYPGRTTPRTFSPAMTSYSADGASVTIQGGGRQRWEREDGIGRWEGFGGVIKTTEIDVTSTEIVSPDDTTGMGEFGRGLTRKDEWDDLPPPPGVLGRARANSKATNASAARLAGGRSRTASKAASTAQARRDGINDIV